VTTLFKICNALEISPAVLFEQNPKKDFAERVKAREIIIDLISRFM
jgi:hypothetical protein